MENITALLLSNRSSPLASASNIEENICDACQLPIVEQFYCQIGEKVFHECCVSCTVCGIQLHEKCFIKNEHIFCPMHYYKECSPFSCAGCKLGIAPTDMVYKLKKDIIYHLTCHRCCECGKQLGVDEEIVIDDVNKAVSCGHHYLDSVAGLLIFGGRGELLADVRGASCSSTASSAMTSATSGEIDSSPPGQCYAHFATAFDAYSLDEYCGEDGKYLKRRGPRTTIKQDQLDVLNRIFSSTPKPSKHARAKLALETGLSMRVIQVWFQNRRSKERRLKHLCNYLRHYEQRGLIPPPIAVAQNGDLLLPKSRSAIKDRAHRADLGFSYSSTINSPHVSGSDDSLLLGQFSPDSASYEQQLPGGYSLSSDDVTVQQSNINKK